MATSTTRPFKYDNDEERRLAKIEAMKKYQFKTTRKKNISTYLVYVLDYLQICDDEIDENMKKKLTNDIEYLIETIKNKPI